MRVIFPHTGAGGFNHRLVEHKTRLGGFFNTPPLITALRLSGEAGGGDLWEVGGGGLLDVKAGGCENHWNLVIFN